MGTVGVGSLVVLHCANPREKMWGLLERLDAVGVALRGLDLETVEDWLHQERAGAGGMIRPSSFFVPMHRVVRIDLDEGGPAVGGIGDRYESICGGDVRQALLTGTDPAT